MRFGSHLNLDSLNLISMANTEGAEIDFTLLISKALTVFYVILYVNFGAILSWKNVKEILKNPAGPAIGLFCNFVLLPLVSCM